MKNPVKTSQMIVLAFVLTIATSFAYANVGKDKAVEKARIAANNAAADDWKTLVKSAKVCIRKNTNMEEALTWLEKSIAIDRNMVNLELLGDYYLAIGDSDMAINTYIEVMKAAKEKDFYYNTTAIESKIANALK